MDSGIDSQHPTAVLAAALEALVEEAGVDAPRALQRVDIEEASWIVLAETGSTATVATGEWDDGGPHPDGQIVHLQETGGQWEARGWGDCADLAPVIERGLQWVQVRAAPDLDPSVVELTVRVNEVECTGGRNPRPFLRPPRVVETDDSVTIYMKSEAPEGGQTCQANPPVRHVVHLTRPLGDRLLLDGSRWPARPVA